MKTIKLNAPGKSPSQSKVTLRRADPLEQLADETGKSVETLRMFAKISDPQNAHLFKAEAAYRAFSHVKTKR
jgi:hypothetical protein